MKQNIETIVKEWENDNTKASIQQTLDRMFNKMLEMDDKLEALCKEMEKSN